MDDFEEVVIPCFVEPKKIKGRPAKDTQKNTTKKAKKPGGTTKGTKQQGTASKPLANRTKTKTNGTKPGGKQDTLPGRGNAGKNPRRTPDIPTKTGATGEESGLDEQRNEINHLEGPLSAATSLQSETSNDSYRGEGLNSTSVDTLGLEHEDPDRRNSDSEEQEDDGNSDVEHDGYEEDDDDDYLEGEGPDDNDEFTSGDVDCDIVSSDVRSDMDAEASGCDSDANVVSSGAVPAKNLQRSQDGQVVLSWTRQAIFALYSRTSRKRTPSVPTTFQ